MKYLDYLFRGSNDDLSVGEGAREEKFSVKENSVTRPEMYRRNSLTIIWRLSDMTDYV